MHTSRSASENIQVLVGSAIVLLSIPFLLINLDPARWNFAPFADGRVWYFLALGAATTVGVSLVSILLSLPLATIFALGRLSTRAWLRYPCIAVIEGIRAVPVLLLIFYVHLRLSSGQDPSVAAIIALTLYTTVVNAETLRAGILSIDKGQMEAARSLGLSYAQAMWLVILPQTYRRVLPPLIAQFATLVKDTSLAAIVGLVELYKRGVIIFQGYRNPLETLFVIAVIYFILNYILGQAGQHVQDRMRQARPVAQARRAA
jgi:His/Glu/Gln/Arg/opine family amino acid ABC transporter permease subunit